MYNSTVNRFDIIMYIAVIPRITEFGNALSGDTRHIIFLVNYRCIYTYFLLLVFKAKVQLHFCLACNEGGLSGNVLKVLKLENFCLIGFYCKI